MTAACTIPGFMFDTLSTKHSLVESNGKGNFDLFLLEVAAFLGRCPCKVRSSYTVMMPMWLTGHKYSPHPLDFRSVLCSAKPAWDFTQDRGSKDQAGSASGWHSCSQCYLGLQHWRHDHAKCPCTCAHSTIQSTTHGYCHSALLNLYAFFCPFQWAGMFCVSNPGDSRES